MFRISPFEWIEPGMKHEYQWNMKHIMYNFDKCIYNINQAPCAGNFGDELENQFNLLNSLWFSFGSLVQQGCDFLPK